MPKEVVAITSRITIRLPEKLHAYLVTEAKKKHTTISAVVVDAIQRHRDGFVAEVFARACLRLLCEARAQDPEGARRLESRLLAEALREARRAREGVEPGDE